MWENCHDYENYTKMTTTQQKTSGTWIATYSAKQFFPLAPRQEDIDIVDIAHSLALQCRFTGHCMEFYSVAEHSVRASYLVPSEHALWALLHDATEAYLTDMSRPIKQNTSLGEEYRKIEKNLMAAICQKFGLSTEEPPQVKIADNIMLMTEKRDLLRNNLAHPKWNETAEPVREYIHPMDWRRAKARFLERYRELTSAGNTETSKNS